jgi:hypothetical protein
VCRAYDGREVDPLLSLEEGQGEEGELWVVRLQDREVLQYDDPEPLQEGQEGEASLIVIVQASAGSSGRGNVSVTLP